MTYDPRDWYWIVGGDESRAWSSAQGAYVPVDDAAYRKWLDAGGVATRIHNEAELYEVLAKAGIPDKGPDVPQRDIDRLAATDIRMARIAEDMWEAVKEKTGLTDDDLPQDARALLAERRGLRRSR